MKGAIRFAHIPLHGILLGQQQCSYKPIKIDSIISVEIRFDFRCSLVSFLSEKSSGEERRLLSRTAADNRASVEI